MSRGGQSDELNEIRSASVTVCLCATTQLSQFTFRRRQPYLERGKFSTHGLGCALLACARTSARLFHLNTRARLCESDDSKPSAQRLTAICVTTTTAAARRSAMEVLTGQAVRTASHRTPPRHDVRILCRRAHPGVALPNVVGVRAARHRNPRDLPCPGPRLLAWCATRRS